MAPKSQGSKQKRAVEGE